MACLLLTFEIVINTPLTPKKIKNAETGNLYLALETGPVKTAK